MKISFNYKKEVVYLLIVITFISIFAVRLWVSIQQPYFHNDESYFHLRQIKNIVDSGLPLYYDPLSYGGRTLFFLPGFHYILSVFILFFGNILGIKIAISLFNAILFLIIYILTNYLIKNPILAYLTAITSAILPLYIIKTMNEVTPFSIFLVLFFLMVYFFLKRSVNYFLFTLLITSLIHPLILLFTLSSVFYIILMFIEAKKIEHKDKELILFTLFFTTWIEFFFHSDIIYVHGWKAIWQNVPIELFNNYFSQIFIAASIDKLGIIAITLGFYGLYITLAKIKTRENFFMVALVISAGLLVWIRIIEGTTGLIILGLLLTIFFGIWLNWFFLFLQKTKISHYHNIFLAGFFILIILSSGIPTYLRSIEEQKKQLQPEDISALKWARELPSEAKILAPPEYGHIITYFANKSNIIDSNYILQKNIDEIYKDIKFVYRTSLYIDVVDTFAKYNADYILISQKILTESKREEWIPSSSNCFELIYNKTTQIYKRKCLRVRPYAV
ncbi:hypothetical protein HYV79_02660 [Candidatus Woesearchaeota archaeon]|nr:hypothetical protein [Candidatus Woesearchaeota archaeon]